MMLYPGIHALVACAVVMNVWAPVPGEHHDGLRREPWNQNEWEDEQLAIKGCSQREFI